MKKRNYSGFTLAEAFKELQLTSLRRWDLDAATLAPSDFFRQRLQRLESTFDTTTSERAKELLIDAICEEALLRHSQLKAWKAALIQSDELTGVVDYVTAPNRSYLDNPLLCVVEAKRDDFSQGLAQCLVEMKACQWSNAQAGNEIDIYGIVTNGEGWKFYKLTTTHEVYETLLYTTWAVDSVFGALDYVFAECVKNIQAFSLAA